jgi:hypothetical protein
VFALVLGNELSVWAVTGYFYTEQVLKVHMVTWLWPGGSYEWFVCCGLVGRMGNGLNVWAVKCYFYTVGVLKVHIVI